MTKCDTLISEALWELNPNEDACEAVQRSGHARLKSDNQAEKAFKSGETMRKKGRKCPHLLIPQRIFLSEFLDATLMNKIILITSVLIASITAWGLYSKNTSTQKHLSDFEGKKNSEDFPSPQYAIVAERDIINTVTETGSVNYKSLYTLNTETSGDLLVCHFKPGDSVKKGDLIVELDNQELLKTKENRVLTLEQAELALSKFNRYEKAERSANATLQLNAAKEKFEQASAALKDAENLLKRGMISEKDRGKIISDQKNAEELLKIETSKYENQAEFDQHDEKTLTKAVEQTRQELKEIDQKIAALKIESPITGILIEISSAFPSEHLKSNTLHLSEGQFVAKIAEEKGRRVEVKLFSFDLHELKVNDPVEILCGPSENRILKGRIGDISAVGIPYGQYLRYPVWVDVLSHDAETLRSEETVQCRFLAQRRNKVLAIPLKFVNFKNGIQFCKVKRQNKVIEAPITTGIDDGEYIEVEGLKASEEVGL